MGRHALCEQMSWCLLLERRPLAGNRRSPMPNSARRLPRPGAPTPGATERQRRFMAALAEFINLPPDDPYLPALAAMVEGLILPALDVLGHGHGHIDIEIRQRWPAMIDRS